MPAPVRRKSSAAFHEKGPVLLRDFSSPIVLARLRKALEEKFLELRSGFAVLRGCGRGAGVWALLHCAGP